MEIKCFCPFLAVCGPAPIYQLRAQREFPCGDPQRDFITTVCGDKDRHLKCDHHKIRVTKEADKNEAE